MPSYMSVYHVGIMNDAKNEKIPINDLLLSKSMSVCDDDSDVGHLIKKTREIKA